MNLRTEISEKKICPTLDSSVVFWLALAAAIFIFQANGYCLDEVQEIENVTNNVMNTIFSPWIKKTALVFGAGAGFFQSYTAGSFKPLFLWGGLGLAVNYIPKVAELIANL